ncbi:hypothetical protein AKJ16_DCAP01560, partial [Drosera capensis]
MSSAAHRTLRRVSPPRSSPFPTPHTTCPICLDQIEHRTAAVIAACNHAYCLACLLTWSDLKPTCPLCNSAFYSYFTWTGFGSSRTVTWQWHRLRRKRRRSTSLAREVGRERIGVSVQRVIWRAREERRSRMSARSRPVPRRRSFGCGEGSDVADKVLRWRESIYRQGFQAVPFSNRCHLQLFHSVPLSTVAKDRILQRIEPWIWRELQAILKDPDPTIIVRVVTSLFISSIERKPADSTGNCDAQGDFLAPLRRFLRGWTDMFWHELRELIYNRDLRCDRGIQTNQMIM